MKSMSSWDLGKVYDATTSLISGKPLGRAEIDALNQWNVGAGYGSEGNTFGTRRPFYSEAAVRAMAQYDRPGTAYTEGYTGKIGKPWQGPGAILGIMRQEEQILSGMKAQEQSYDTAYAQAQKAQEMAKMKSGVIGSDLSAAQKTIGGEQKAGIEKAGQFKSIYGAGSMLPASWMQSKLDPTKVAQKISGLEDRNAPVTQRYGGGELTPFEETYARSKFTAPTVQKTGLGRYATIV